jgi:hypothetical protein
MQVDQARDDDETDDVADVGGGIAPQLGADLGNPAIAKGNVKRGIEPLRGVDDAATAQNEVEGHGLTSRGCWRGVVED